MTAPASNLTQTLKRSEPESHRPKSTTHSTLYKDVLHLVGQMVLTLDADPPHIVKLAFCCGQPEAHFAQVDGKVQICKQYLRKMGHFNVYIEKGFRSLIFSLRKLSKTKSVCILVVFLGMRDW